MIVVTAEEVRRIFRYDPETGNLIWVQPAWNWQRLIGTVAGTIHKRHGGRRLVVINHRSYLVHRLVWLYHNGTWPTDQIDHINRDPSDNRIENLREASGSQNQANRRLSLPRSGIRGVYKYAQGDRWFSHIRLNGKRVFLGSFRTPEDAGAAYRTAHTRFFGEFSSEFLGDACSNRANGLPAVF